MDKWIIISIVIIVLLGITSFILMKNLSNPQPSPEEKKECNTLTYNGENRINLVFFSTKKQAEKYSDFLMSISPFNENKNEFNFYYIDNYQPECELYEDVAILCYNKDLIKKASICPNDFIVVIEDKDEKIRSSAYMDVLSINLNHQLTVIAHEFAHSFANFAEEYTPAKIPKNSENCASSCEEFKGYNNECKKGCSEEDYYRSIDAGIMRTLSSESFGEFNENLLRERMGLNRNTPITGNVIENTKDCSEEYLLIEGTYHKDGTMTISDTSTQMGCVGSGGVEGFEYKVTLKSGSTSTKNFNPQLMFTDSQEEGEEEISGETFLITDRPFYIKATYPNLEEIQSLEIKKEDSTLAKINLEESLGMSPTDIDNIPCKQ
ncbi:MAG: hypothetical protein NUV97_03655 [archaeon]|nr:hypothetical protein [archaeon]MCR4323887.1 hypothetical protein [Nanoarchaeota archaeon]